MTPLTWAAFAAAGATGAIVRYGIDTALARRATTAFPRGTLLVNLLGSLLLGALIGVGSDASRPVVLVVGTGFCGAFTTFSTFCYETVLLIQDSRFGTALSNVAATALGCVGAAAVGVFVVAAASTAGAR